VLRFLLLFAASLGVTMVLAFAAVVRRPLVRLVRAVLLGLTAVMGVTAIALIGAGVSNDNFLATSAGAAIALLTARIGWPLLRRRRPRHERALEHVPLTRAEPDVRWRQLETGLDWVSRQQARQSRAAIEGFLAERDSESLTHEHRALLLSCEKRVPELIDTCLDRCRNASRQERERYLDETLDRLVQLGGEAERARQEVRDADDRRLRTLHRYFDGVAGGKDGPN
jgi:hypothetical protein